MTEGRDTHLSPPLCLRVWGERACFTRPEMKVERVSYDVMTPSAARGTLEAILWKPQMRWIVERIDVLKPIRRDSVRRNEVSDVISMANVKKAMNGTPVALGIDVTTATARRQRAALILRDVAYVIHARIALTGKAGPGDSLNKYVEMFKRRAGAGQCFHRPYLGTREFAADFALVTDDEAPTAITENIPLGWMLLDIDYMGAKPTPLFFDAKLENGSLAVPDPKSGEIRR